MLHESAIQPDYTPPLAEPVVDPREQEARQLLESLYRHISDYLQIEQVESLKVQDLALEDRILAQRGTSQAVFAFRGQFKPLADNAYDVLDETLRELNCFALFRKNAPDARSPNTVYVLLGRLATPQAPRWGIAWGLLLATVVSLLMTGTTIAVGEIGLTDSALAQQINANFVLELWRGWPYALAILLILVPHEMSHYLTMRRYGTPASLPYFIPAFGISPFGTFGAVITMRSPLRNRRVLFDVGASGPLAGFILTVPILLFGLATSPVTPITGGWVEGNSVLYALAKVVTFGHFLPDGRVDVLLNQWAWAGWTGLFVTALNLLPIGQLDGGHVMYASQGRKARDLYWPLVAALGLLTLFVSSIWMMFTILLLLFGRVYAVPLDDVTRLDNRRRRLAWVLLALFLVIFTPVPLYHPEISGGLLYHAPTLTEWGIMSVLGVIASFRMWRR